VKAHDKASSVGNQRKPLDLGALTASIGLIFGIVAACLSLAGWSFARAYLSHFQLGFQSVDLPFDILILYGFWVAKANWHWLLALASIVVGLAIWRPWQTIGTSFPMLFLVGLLALIPAFILVDVVAGNFASETFEMEKVKAFPYNRRVKVFVDLTETSADFPNDLGEGCYRLLIKDKTNLVVFRPVSRLESIPPTVFVMPWEKVAGFWVLHDSTSCP